MSDNPRSLKRFVRRGMEAEDCIADALYLLQLCQQDLNMGRKETVWPRARAAKDLCASLEAMFEPKFEKPNPELTNAALTQPRPQPAPDGKDLSS